MRGGCIIHRGQPNRPQDHNCKGQSVGQPCGIIVGDGAQRHEGDKSQGCHKQALGEFLVHDCKLAEDQDCDSKDGDRKCVDTESCGQ